MVNKSLPCVNVPTHSLFTLELHSSKFDGCCFIIAMIFDAPKVVWRRFPIS